MENISTIQLDNFYEYKSITCGHTTAEELSGLIRNEFTPGGYFVVHVWRLPAKDPSGHVTIVTFAKLK